jgi:hypothetical protein
MDVAIRRPRHVVGPAGQAHVQRPPRLTANPNARRRLNPELARLVRRGAVTFAKAGQGVVDDFPQTIPVAPRELDVIETYLGRLLDDALGEREEPEIRLGESPPRCENDR